VYGFDNINAAQGWSMALLGAFIVFCGLASLSFLIAQIHKLLEYWENRKKAEEPLPAAVAKPAKAVPAAQKALTRLPQLDELVSIYRPLVEQLEEPFQLALVYQAAAKMDLPHAHLSINCLRENEILLPHGEGAFVWNGPKADSL
jgi:hypothetical protein